MTVLAEGLIENSENAYKRLSRVTAAARRAGDFPALMDRTRSIERVRTFASPGEGLRVLARSYAVTCSKGRRRCR
jgi:hypothetical protein